MDILYGIGGTPEGVITVATLKCMDGDLQGHPSMRNDEERAAILEVGIDPDKIISLDDLVTSDDCFFAATDISSGSLLQGVRYSARTIETESLVMNSRSETVRLINGTHRASKLKDLYG